MSTPTRPCTAQSHAADTADTRDVVLLHDAFRREFRLLPGLVRETGCGQVARAATVADHLQLITGFLHHHHTGEDRLLWPVLLERADSKFAPVVLLMEAQHEGVAEQLELVEGLSTAFAATAGPQEQVALASACDVLYLLLEEHLTAEETRVLPLAERYISQQEWNEMGEEGLGTLPKRQLPIAFGMMSYQGDPEVLADMIAPAPLPIRLLVPPLGRRAFRRYALRVHGTATP
jgi:hemerythrin-like domain-containing protein